MPRLRSIPNRRHSLRGESLEPLDSDDLVTLALCTRLGTLPEAPAGSDLQRAQELFLSGSYDESTETVRKFIYKSGLDVRRKRYKLDPGRLASVRCIRRFSQAELAKAIGCTAAQISHIETGRSGISLHFLLAVLAVLDIPSGALGVQV